MIVYAIYAKPLTALLSGDRANFSIIFNLNMRKPDFTNW